MEYESSYEEDIEYMEYILTYRYIEKIYEDPRKIQSVENIKDDTLN